MKSHGRMSLVRLILFLSVVCLGQEQFAVGADVDYAQEIKPVLKARCYACHGALKQEAGLRLDTVAAMRQGGENGATLRPEQVDQSLLLQRISSTQAASRMPPAGEPLSSQQIEKIRQWIAAGASGPEQEVPESDPRQHWSFQPPVKAPLPPGNGSNSSLHPVDAWLNRDLQRQGLVAQPEAARSVQLRRLSLDLIGLPPTRAELEEFLQDESPQAYERVVDRLLNDPRHGERWARHWMDIWRYSDWYGRRDSNDVRNSAGQIFRWRDWIVRSLNENQGYDQMVQHMLAADEICPEDDAAGVATGFLIRNYYSLNANDWMRSAVEHTGKAFLGLTFNCAHCHDHKYDPIAQTEYFALRACFEPVYIRQDRVAGEPDPGPFQDYTYAGSRTVQRLGAVRIYDRTPDAPTWFYSGGDERNRETEKGTIPPGVPQFLNPEGFQITPVTLPPQAWYPGLRPAIQETLRQEAQQAVRDAEQHLAGIPESAPTSTAEFSAAEGAYNLAVQQAQDKGEPGALSGEQSLLLDASSGRAIVQHPVPALGPVTEGMQIEFQVLILQDAHFNFQLLKEEKQGWTADYVGWDQGRLMAYKVGEANEIQVARYDVQSGQTRFLVQLILKPAADQALLTVKCLNDGTVLVDQLPTRLSGWNPAAQPNQSILFDARPGSVVVLDEVRITKPASEGADDAPIYQFDFESQQFADGSSPIGQLGWTSSTFAQASGVTQVSRTAANVTLRNAAEQLQKARRQIEGPGLKRRAAAATVVAAQAALLSLNARIEAETSRSLQPDNPANSTLAMTASQAERRARLLKAESQVLATEATLFAAESMPTDAMGRPKALESATQSLAQSRQELAQAQTALADEKLASTYAPLSPQYPTTSTGRRRALALWITNRQNPLAARVAVNHVWNWHFHSPLVGSVTDFGRNGDKPTHPELLDWLAVEFMESGWDLKHLHRLLVTSAAYRRLSNEQGSQAADLDPENRWYWRMNSSRMEAEVVRDSLLFVAGRLDFTMGGVELENKDALTTFRRSLYYSTYPEGGGKSLFGELFNAPDPLDCYRRVTSVVPQQALALTNSELVLQSAQALVAKLQQEAPLAATDTQGTQQLIAALFETVLSRSPTPEELRACEEILSEQIQLAAGLEAEQAHQKARESLARILLNHNDFITVR